MALLSADSFNRANSTTSIGTTDGAGSLDPLAWTTRQGTCGINSNKAYAVSTANVSSWGAAAAATVELATADADISITLATLDSAPGIIFRWSSTTNFWLVFENTSDLKLYKMVANTLTQVG